MTAELLYPKRQRCRRCHKYFSFAPPLKGLYCSRECAGMPPVPVTEFRGVQIPPRSCRLRLNRSGTPVVKWKAVFSTEAEAVEAVRRNKAKGAYECPSCGYWHLTSMTRGPRHDR